MLSSILSIGLPVLIVAIIVILLAMGYVKAPPNTAYLISGLRKRTVIGKARRSTHVGSKGILSIKYCAFSDYKIHIYYERNFNYQK